MTETLVEPENPNDQTIGIDTQLNVIRELIAKDQPEQIDAYFLDLPAGEIPRVFGRLTVTEQNACVQVLSKEPAALVLDALPELQAAQILAAMPSDAAASVLEELDSDEQADLIDQLDAEQSEKILEALPEQEAASIRFLASFDRDSAGSSLNSGPGTRYC